MNFIKKVLNGEKSDFAHLQFQKFSKGEFRDKALIEAKKMGKGWAIKTSGEFTNELVRIAAKKLGENKTLIKGVIISTLDLDGELEFIKKSNFQGVKKYSINTEMSGNQIIELLDKMPKNFFALTFDVKTDNTKLKIKPKSPKASKDKKTGDAKADFCTLKTTDEAWVKSFIFEKPDFKKAIINHTYFIEEMILPEGEDNFAKMREMAIRKGRIIRKTNIDENENSKEYNFEA